MLWSPFCNQVYLLSAFYNVGDANSSSSGSVVFGATFATNTSTSGATLSTSTTSTSDNLFALSMPGPQISSSSFVMPQASTLPFGSGFHKSTTSTDLVSSAASTSNGSPLKHGDPTKQPSSAALTLGSFPVFNSSASSSKDVSLGSGFGEVNTTKPVLTFGVTGQPSEARSINLSSPSKPLFPIMSQSVSVFKTTRAIKPQPAGMFGQSLHSTTQGHQAKENKEKITDKKIKTISTADLTALVIKGIPEMCNKNTWLKRFYSRFGEVTKVICTANKSCATVIFKTHVSRRSCYLTVKCMYVFICFKLLQLHLFKVLIATGIRYKLELIIDQFYSVCDLHTHYSQRGSSSFGFR